MRTLPFAPDAVPAIIVPVVGRTVGAMHQQVAAAMVAGGADVLEWRVDALLAGSDEPEGSSSTAARALMDGFEAVAAAGPPVLATLRSEAEGGECPLDRYSELMASLIGVRVPAREAAPAAWSRPTAVDVEIAREGATDLVAAAHGVGASVVASAHEWSGTPGLEEIVERLARMESAGADVAKIAVMPHSVSDVLRLMQATHTAAGSLGIPVIGIAMGELGRMTRVCSAEFGSAGTFATAGAASAPGQLTAAQVAAVREVLRR